MSDGAEEEVWRKYREAAAWLKIDDRGCIRDPYRYKTALTHLPNVRKGKGTQGKGDRC